MNYKVCRECDESFPQNSEFFGKDSSKRDGLRNRCRTCESKVRRECAASIRKSTLSEDDYKTCLVCGEVKEPCRFHNNKKNSYEDNHTCKDCKRKGLKVEIPLDVPYGMKRCSKCKEIKLADTENFYVNKKAKRESKRLFSCCKACASEIRKEYSVENREKIRERYKRYYEENKEKVLIRNKVKTNERKQQDLKFATILRCRNLIGNAFHRKGFPKTGRTRDILGCGWEQFIEHLESQFTEGMCWDNYGVGGSSWCIDHKVAVNLAFTPEDVERLNHYTNLRPMWSTYNIIKGDMTIDEWEDYKKYNHIDESVPPSTLS